MWGAGGGGSYFNPSSGRMQSTGFGGGAGGFTYCVLPVNPGDSFQIMVGGAGLSSAFPGTWTLKLPGGYGGGGNSWGSGIDASAGSGGGRSAIFNGNVELATAGGGGGGGCQCQNNATSFMQGGGGGGGLTAPTIGTSSTGYSTGGSQTAGGAPPLGGGGVGTLGQGGSATAFGGGGGGGYWGGSGGWEPPIGCNSLGGSGGSGYIGSCTSGASYSGGQGGIPGSAQALPNRTDSSYMSGIGIGGIAQVNAPGSGGHGLVVISYTLNTPTPTALPSAVPTPTPSSLPTAQPTQRPVMRPATSAQWVWEEQHLGVSCASTPHEFSVLQLRLNSCSAPDATSSRYHKFSCKLGDFKSSVLRQDYDDNSCTSKRGSPYLENHAFYCRADARTGGYVRTKCGDFSPTEVKNKAQLLLQWFPAMSKKKTPVCSATNAVTRILLLERCLPQSKVSKDKRASYYYTLSYSSSTAESITLTERRFGKEDKRCAGSAFLTKTVLYSRRVATSSPGGCASDPVSPALGAYAAAMYHDGSVSSWAGLQLFIRGSTAEPSAAPTFAPTSPTGQPTGQPSRQPTGQPTGQPTLRIAAPVNAPAVVTMHPTPMTTAGAPTAPAAVVVVYSGTASSYQVTRYYSDSTCSSAPNSISVSYSGLCGYFMTATPYSRKSELSSQEGNLAYVTSSDYTSSDCTGTTTSVTTTRVSTYTSQTTSVPLFFNNCTKSYSQFSMSSITTLPPLSGLVQESFSGAGCTGVARSAQVSPMGYCIRQGMTSMSMRSSCFNATHTVSEWWSTSDCTTSAGYSSTIQRMKQPDATNTPMTIGTCFTVSYGGGNMQYMKAKSCIMPKTVDGQALCDMFNALTTPASKSALTNWCPGSAPYDPCVTGVDNAWRGVTCGTVGGATRVSGLDISGLGLVGIIPNTIGYLDALLSLSAAGNPDLTGSFPSLFVAQPTPPPTARPTAAQTL